MRYRIEKRRVRFGKSANLPVGAQIIDTRDSPGQSIELITAVPERGDDYTCGGETADGDECSITVDGPDERCHLHADDGE